ncbi:SDR family oxidoreductase [Streptomyces sp. NPDC020800]|uniref:SDR family oxidoreductase n=1 Tax=Streptomyces sp. NPDC020800 TaxID=3365092 RepID=UPI0037A5BE10
MPPPPARSALITGAARRIGAALAEDLAAQGYCLHLHAHTSGALLEQVAEDLRTRHGVRVRTHLADLADVTAVRRLVHDLIEDPHPPALVINNASEFLGHYDRAECTDIDTVARTLMVNTAVPIALSGVAAHGGNGHVVNITDAHTDLTCASHLPYDVSKAALADATARLAVLLAPGVRVNAVAPALVLPPPGAGEAELHEMAGRAPLLRPAPPADIVAAVRFLTGTASVTGQTIMIDSGAHLVWDSESDLRPQPVSSRPDPAV